MTRTWVVVRAALAAILIGLAGALLSGAPIFALLAAAGMALLLGTWIVAGTNDGYGPRSTYPKASDLARADDVEQDEVHPGPLPPQPPMW